MSPRLKLFRITTNLMKLDSVLERFVNLEKIHPIEASKFVFKVRGGTTFETINPITKIYTEIETLEQEIDLIIPVTKLSMINYSLDEMRDYVFLAHEKLNKLTSFKKETVILIKKYKDARKQITNIENLDISFDDLFSCEYVNARFGKMPLDSVEKLKLYEKKPYIFKSLLDTKNHCWCMYLSTNKYEREIDNIFSSLFFERIFIPDFIHGKPENAIASLSKEIKVTTKSLKGIQTEIDIYLNQNLKKLAIIKSKLFFLNKMYHAKKYVLGLGDKFSITGFVENKQVKMIQEVFGSISDSEVEIMPPNLDKRLIPPKKIKNSWF